ncbi:MAG: hypothetical protein ABEJ31_01025 [Haloarculaceae archaeon]
MDGRPKASLLWGLVGGLAFLVLVQGYQLVADVRVAMLPVLGVAVLVVAVGSALAYATDRHTAARKEQT